MLGRHVCPCCRYLRPRSSSWRRCCSDAIFSSGENGPRVEDLRLSRGYLAWRVVERFFVKRIFIRVGVELVTQLLRLVSGYLGKPALSVSVEQGCQQLVVVNKDASGIFELRVFIEVAVKFLDVQFQNGLGILDSP